MLLTLSNPLLVFHQRDYTLANTFLSKFESTVWNYFSSLYNLKIYSWEIYVLFFYFENILRLDSTMNINSDYIGFACIIKTQSLVNTFK